MTCSLQLTSTLVVLGLLGTLSTSGSLAQQPGSNVAAVATYQGADRTQKLIEGAKKEGRLSITPRRPSRT